MDGVTQGNQRTHDGDCRTHTGSVVNMQSGIHCCECWRYTDQKNDRAQIVGAAINLMTSTGNRDTAAFRAADKFLADAFRVDKKNGPGAEQSAHHEIRDAKTL